MRVKVRFRAIADVGLILQAEPMKQAVAVLISIAVAGCASVPANTVAGLSEGAEVFDGMTLDLNMMRVVTPNWTTALVDCSDEAIECVEAPGYFLLSVPRHCSRDGAWEAGGFSYRAIAPSPHYGLPSGSYMSMKYPHVHWLFGAPLERGVHRWARTLGTPSDRAWDTNDTIEEYQVRIVSADSSFRCG